MEGKEVRFGIALSVLLAVITTAASCGAVNAMHDSFTPLAGMVPLVNIQLGEVVFGGVGAGLYGMLIYRDPGRLHRRPDGRADAGVPRQEDRALRDEDGDAGHARAGRSASSASPAWPSVGEWGTKTLNNPGAHGFSEILYAFTSQTGNNGSAFAGIGANNLFYNTTVGLAMLIGRFLMIVPMLALAGSLAAKRRVPPSLGTFPTTGGSGSACWSA